jgi:glycine/D-amino acid oxidase-like deaminating enzyme
VRLLSVRVGMRPMPTDGHPVIGPLPTVRGAYVAVMHSGVTLAPVAGRLVAEEVVRGVEAPELRGCRPA